MRRKFCGLRSAAIWGASVALFGCAPDVPTAVSSLPDVAGEWNYQATEVRIGGSPGGTCSISGVTLQIGPWRSSGFFGRSDGGQMTCTGTLSPLSGSLQSYPVRRGGAVAEYIAFDIGTPDWRHEGVLVADTMRGVFRLTHSGLSLVGSFRAVRRSNSFAPVLVGRSLQTEK